MWNSGSFSSVDPATITLDAKILDELGNMLLTGAELDKLR